MKHPHRAQAAPMNTQPLPTITANSDLAPRLREALRLAQAGGDTRRVMVASEAQARAAYAALRALPKVGPMGMTDDLCAPGTIEVWDETPEDGSARWGICLDWRPS